jgi:hypothetical protein
MVFSTVAAVVPFGTSRAKSNSAAGIAGSGMYRTGVTVGPLAAVAR